MHDLVVRDLEQARNRTLWLTDLDDPTLVTQHDLLMSPDRREQRAQVRLEVRGRGRPVAQLDRTAGPPRERD